MDERLRQHILKQIRGHQEKIAALQLLLVEGEKDRNFELKFEGSNRHKGFAPKKGSIMEGVLKVLRSEPKGLKALEILDRLNATDFPDLVRTSLSPQLSRLKQRGYLEYEDRHWRIKPELPLLEVKM